MTFGAYLFIGTILALLASAILVVGFSRKNKMLKVIGIVVAVFALYIVVSIVWMLTHFDA